jgi:protein SCO1/2
MAASANSGTGAERLFCLAVLLLSLGVAACQHAGETGIRRYHLRGTVVQVDRSLQHLVVNHEEIRGFMAAMTMPYPVADAQALDELSPGDQITADVVVTASEIHLENIVVVKKSDGKAAAARAPSKQNQPAPDFALVNQDGKRIHLAQYRGKAVLLTFIYTRCPLPDYCPLVSHNFAEIEKQLVNSPDIYAKTHLLSISFDSQYDTPKVLRNYASGFVADRGPHTFEHWEFATIPAAENSEVTKFFDVFVTQEQGQITHSMDTAILSPDGRICKTYTGNEWKPADVLADLKSCAAASETSKTTDRSLKLGEPAVARKQA